MKKVLLTVLGLFLFACASAQTVLRKGAKIQNEEEINSITSPQRFALIDTSDEGMVKSISLANLTSQLNLVSGNLTQEEVEDIIGNLIANGTQSANIGVVYNDNGVATGTLDFTVTGDGNDFPTAASLSGTVLTITIPGQSDVTVDLASIEGGTNDYNQLINTPDLSIYAARASTQTFTGSNTFSQNTDFTNGTETFRIGFVGNQLYLNPLGGTALTYNYSTSQWLIGGSSIGGNGLSNLVEDNSPELGGVLDGGTFGMTNVGSINAQNITGLDFTGSTLTLINGGDNVRFFTSAQGGTELFGIGLNGRPTSKNLYYDNDEEWKIGIYRILTEGSSLSGGSIATGSVNANRISSAGGTEGQVLGVSGGSVAWVNQSGGSTTISYNYIDHPSNFNFNASHFTTTNVNNVNRVEVGSTVEGLLDSSFLIDGLKLLIEVIGSGSEMVVYFSEGSTSLFKDKNGFTGNQVTLTNSDHRMVGIVENKSGTFYINIGSGTVSNRDFITNLYTGAGADGEPDSNDISGFSSGTASLFVNTNLSNVRNGTTSLEVTDNAGLSTSEYIDYILPSFPVGTQRIFTAWFKASTGVSLGIRGYSPASGITYVTGNDDWQQISVQVTSDGGTSRVRFYVDEATGEPTTGNKTAYIDDILIYDN